MIRLARLLVAASLAATPALAQDAGVPDDAPDAGVVDTSDPVAALAPAEPLSFKALLDHAEVTLGEVFTLSIDIKHPADQTYDLPPSFDWKDIHFREKTTERTAGDPVVTHHILKLQGMTVGEAEIPLIRLLVNTPAGARKLEIPSQKVKVNGVIDATQGEPQMREDTRPLPTKRRPLWWPILALLALASGFLLAWWMRRRAMRPVPPPPPKPRDPPDVEALARLTKLEQDALIAQGQSSEYYFRLSEIVREYIGRRYAFEALELTSDELLEEARKRPTPGLDFDGFARFVHSSELVKFAKLQPTVGEAKEAIELARVLVERSRPPPPPPPGSAPRG